MRTGRTLTVFRWRAPPPKKYPPRKKYPPQNTPPKKYPPQKNTPPPKLEQNLEHTPPLWTDTRLWKYYLGQNFVSAGNQAVLFSEE